MMGSHIYRRLSLALLLVGGVLSAQGLEYGFRAGFGQSIKGGDEQKTGLSLHAGFSIDYKLAEKRSVYGELTYQYFRAERWENPLPASGYTPSGATAAMNPNNSIWLRKDNLDGLGLNFGYRQVLPGCDDWYWQAGLNLQNLKSEQEVIGELNVPAATPFKEGLSFVYSKNAIKPGVFVGVRGFLNKETTFEVNASTVSFSQLEYVPLAATGQAAHTETRNKTKVVLSFSAGFRF